MRYESSITSLSWIPSEAVTGASAWRSTRDSPTTTTRHPRSSVTSRNSARATSSGSPTCSGLGRGRRRRRDQQRRLRGAGMMGATTVQLAGLTLRFQAVKLPDIQRPPEHGRAGCGSPRPSAAGLGAHPPAGQAPPYVQWLAPLVWTTLTLTLHADGTAEREMTGASAFPRHWVYGADGHLTHKSGLTDYRRLVRHVIRQAQPLGRRGFPGSGHRGRDRPGTGAVRAAHARRGQAGDQPVQRGRHAGAPGRTGNLQSTWCWTEWSGWNETASGSPSTGPGRYSASGPTWKAASARPRWLR